MARKNRSKGYGLVPKSSDSHDVAPLFASDVSHARHTAVGTIQGLIASALCLPTGILTAAFLTRQLGPQNYGLLTVAATIVVWLELITSVGFNRGAVKFVAEAENWRSISTRFLHAQLLISLATSLLLFAVAPALALWLDAPELSTYLRLFSLDIPLNALGNIHSSILIGRGHFGRRAILKAVFWLSRLVLIFLLVGFHPTIGSAILAMIGASFLVFIWARAYIRPPFLGRSEFPLRQVWDYAWPLFFFTVGISLFNRVDLLFVKAMSSLRGAAGFYGAAQNMTIAPGLLANSLSPLLLAKLSLLSAREEEDTARNITKQAVRLVFCLLPFAAMGAGAAPEVVVAIYGQPFLPSGPLLAVLIFGAVGSTMIAITASVLIAVGRPKLPFLLTGPIVVAASYAHYMMIPYFGPIAAASITTGLAWIGAGITTTAVCRIWQFYPPVSTLATSILISGLAYALAALWPAPGFLLLLKLPVIALFVVILFLLLGEISSREIAFVRSMFDWRMGSEKK